MRYNNFGKSNEKRLLKAPPKKCFSTNILTDLMKEIELEDQKIKYNADQYESTDADTFG